jgi:hypothetical protein
MITKSIFFSAHQFGIPDRFITFTSSYEKKNYKKLATQKKNKEKYTI